MRAAMKNMKLSNKLFISFTSFCVISLIILSILYYNVGEYSLKENALSFANLFTSQLITQIDEYINRIDKTSTILQGDQEILTFLSREYDYEQYEKITYKLAVDNLLTIMHSQNPNILRISIISASETICSSNDTLDAGILKEQEWFQNIVQSKGSLYITGLHDQKYVKNTGRENQSVVTIGRYLIDAFGAYCGVLLFDLDPESIIQMTEQKRAIISEYDFFIKMMNKDEDIVFIYPGQPESSMNNVSDHAKLDISQTTLTAGMKINIQIPEDKLYSKLTIIQEIAGIYLFCIAIAAVILSFILSRTITLPMYRLMNSMNHVKEGNYAPVLLDQRKDEIGQLADTYNTMIATIKKLIEEVYISKLQKKNAEYLALQTQIHPHMLYNTLENIRMRAVINNDMEVAGMIKALGRMFRLTLSKEKKKHVIADEIEYVSLYIKLLNMRRDRIYTLIYDLPEEILSNEIIRFTFQPLVENCIIHGFENREDECIIRISAEFEGTGILIHLSDNGKGMDGETLNKVKSELHSDENNLTEDINGIGLKNIYDRIKLEYGDDFYLDIDSVPSMGTEVRIFIPASGGAGDV